MQPDHESDELETLLCEEYGAPPLEKQFSAGLISRLQAEASPLSPRLKAPGRSRRSLLAICVGFAVVAASIFAVLWIVNRPDSGKVRESARREKTDYNRLARGNVDTMALESESARESEKLDPLSDHPRTRTLSLSESLREVMPESKRPESESKPSSESLAPRTENLATEDRASAALSQPTQMSVLATVVKEWPNVSAAAALANMLYVVDSGRLYEVNPDGGSRRSVGEDHWQNTAAMAAAGNFLYLVSDNQLYEVNPKTGARRSVGKPDWVSTKTIVTVGDKLYIVSNGWLHRLNPKDGSCEVLHGKTESLKQTLEPKQ
jgi:hypothetical protein